MPELRSRLTSCLPSPSCCNLAELLFELCRGKHRKQHETEDRHFKAARARERIKRTSQIFPGADSRQHGGLRSLTECKWQLEGRPSRQLQLTLDLTVCTNHCFRFSINSRRRG